jgi:type IV secretion system protein VirB3
MAELVRAPIFRALTQPQMFAGVTYNFFVINGVVTTEAFLISRALAALGLALALHAVGYLACLREPRIFDLWLTRVSRCPRNSAWRLWRCNIYLP